MKNLPQISWNKLDKKIIEKAFDDVKDYYKNNGIILHCIYTFYKEGIAKRPQYEDKLITLCIYKEDWQYEIACFQFAHEFAHAYSLFTPKKILWYEEAFACAISYFITENILTSQSDFWKYLTYERTFQAFKPENFLKLLNKNLKALENKSNCAYEHFRVSDFLFKHRKEDSVWEYLNKYVMEKKTIPLNEFPNIDSNWLKEKKLLEIFE